MLKKHAATLVSVLVVMAVWAPPATAYAPPEGSLFNNPKGNHAAQYRLINRVNTAIRHAPRGSTVLIATYLFDRRSSADALIGARNRGVSVQVVMDGGITSLASRRIQRVLNRDNGRGSQWGPDNSFAIKCSGSCRGAGPNQAMHSKFYAFSRTGTARNVVMVSSANLNKGGAVKGYNDMFTMRAVPTMYQTYRRVHAQMAQDRVTGDPYVVHREGRFESRFFPKRHASKRTDPTYQALGKVRCHGAGGGAGRGGRTAINISMFYWGGERGVYLARRLLDLQHNGCLVSVIYGAPGDQVARILRHSAWNGGIKLYDSRVDRNGDHEVDLRVHHKYMLISGKFAGDSSSWQVFTGSQNWQKGSLTGGDEVTLQVSARPAYAHYINNWQFVRDHGTRKIGR